jgi:hypothetical protein
MSRLRLRANHVLSKVLQLSVLNYEKYFKQPQHSDFINGPKLGREPF